VVRCRFAAAAPHLVQRALLDDLLDQPLVDAGAAGGQTARPLPLLCLRLSCTQTTGPSFVRNGERIPCGHAHLAGRQKDATDGGQSPDSLPREAQHAVMRSPFGQSRDAVRRLPQSVDARRSKAHAFTGDARPGGRQPMKPHAGRFGCDGAGPFCPVLYAPRMTLEPLGAPHAAGLFPLLADGALGRYTDERAPATLDALTERFRRWEARESPDGSQLWLNWALALPTSELAGFVQATVMPDRSAADIAYVVGRRYWSAGFATEAVHAVLAFLHDELAVRCVQATVDARNLASRRVLEKLGFVASANTDPRNLRFTRSQ